MKKITDELENALVWLDDADSKVGRLQQSIDKLTKGVTVANTGIPLFDDISGAAEWTAVKIGGLQETMAMAALAAQPYVDEVQDCLSKVSAKAVEFQVKVEGVGQAVLQKGGAVFAGATAYIDEYANKYTEISAKITKGFGGIKDKIDALSKIDFGPAGSLGKKLGVWWESANGAFEKINGKIGGHITTVQEKIGQWKQVFEEKVGSLVTKVTSKIQSVNKFVGSVSSNIQLAQQVFGTATRVVGQAGAIISSIPAVMSAAGEKVSGFMEKWNNFSFSETFSEAWEKVKGGANQFYESVKGGALQIYDQVTGGASKTLEQVQNAMGGVTDVLDPALAETGGAGGASEALEQVQNAMGGALGPLGSVLENTEGLAGPLGSGFGLEGCYGLGNGELPVNEATPLPQMLEQNQKADLPEGGVTRMLSNVSNNSRAQDNSTSIGTQYINVTRDVDSLRLRESLGMEMGL